MFVLQLLVGVLLFGESVLFICWVGFVIVWVVLVVFMVDLVYVLCRCSRVFAV